MRIPLSKPNIGDLEQRYVADAVAAGWISGTGSYVSAFESALQTRLGRRFAVAMSSGTQALEITLQALGIGRDDEVIVPALTFASPAAAVFTSGAQPILADITEDTWTINPAEVKRLITPRTKAIIAVDIIGHPCDFDALKEFELPVIEDAAEAHGSRYRGTLTGNFGVASVFSFHANKTVTTGEGGCVVTDDTELAEKIRLISNHGMTPSRPYQHSVVGRNGRMTNLAAAIGLAQMERWDELVTGRAKTGVMYENLLPDTFRLPPRAAWASITPWLQTVLATDRDNMVAAVRESDIDVRAIWPAISDLKLYETGVRRRCLVATTVASQAMWLPTWSDMSNDLIVDVTRALESLSAEPKR